MFKPNPRYEHLNKVADLLKHIIQHADGDTYNFENGDMITWFSKVGTTTEDFVEYDSIIDYITDNVIINSQRYNYILEEWPDDLDSCEEFTTDGFGTYTFDAIYENQLAYSVVADALAILENDQFFRVHQMRCGTWTDLYHEDRSEW
jgi:hypothetical protein